MSKVEIDSDDLAHLCEIAEEGLYMWWDNLHVTPHPADGVLMLHVWELLGKDPPPFFLRTFGWGK